MAPVWGWILAYLLGFLLFQAVVYWYLQEDGASFDKSTPGYVEGNPRPGPSIESQQAAGGADARHCPHCGAINERGSEYTYCRECVGELR